MKIEKIKIENFRGILNAELEFDSQLNVFIGGNGAGKTTMLHAIGQCLFKVISGVIEYKYNYKSIFQSSEKDINYSQDYFQIKTTIKIKDFNNSALIGVSEGNVPDTDTYNFVDSYFQVLRHFLEEDLDTLTIPIIKFYSPSKNLTSYHNVEYEMFPIPQLETWSNLYSDNISFSKFLKWFFDRETQELRLKRNAKDFDVESKDLAPIREVIEKALKILFKKNYLIKSDQIIRRGNNELIPTLILEDQDTDLQEDLNNKSDGEKAIITLIADIAYNLSIAKDFSEGDDFLSSPGIVLIDEIEAHLHPNWQREIIPLLIQLFPNIQFFITTHSPQILSSVESQHVFICEDFKFSKINIKSKGLDSNSLLKYVFNSTERPKKYVELIEKFDGIIEEEGSIEELESIIEKIDVLNADDRGQDIGLLVNDLKLQIEAYKFDLAHETH